MKIIADEKIPGLKEELGEWFKFVFLPAEDITASYLKEACGLIVRSTVKVNQALLKESSVKWVATPVSGTDHVDEAYLKQHDIALFSAPGSNAASVRDYVLWNVAWLMQQGYLGSKGCAGIIGAGFVGCLIQEMFIALGWDVKVYDPLRYQNDEQFRANISSVKHLKDLMGCDFISVHASLSQEGPYPSYHLLNKSFFDALPLKTIVLNASRGALVDTQAFWNYVERHSNFHYILDVYEHEPYIFQPLVSKSLIATPHIAGHTQESFTRGAQKIIRDIRCYYHKEKSVTLNTPEKTPVIIKINHACYWYDIVLRLYDFKIDETLCEKNFYEKRKRYAKRREFTCIPIEIRSKLPDSEKAILESLSFNLV